MNEYERSNMQRRAAMSKVAGQLIEARVLGNAHALFESKHFPVFN
jgi:hypothetical protein